MNKPRGPTVRQRRLAAELRRLREYKELTGDDVAERLGWSTAKVSRVENARSRAAVEDVRRLLELYEVNGSRLDELMTLAREATEKRWWEDYRDLGTDQAQFIAMEAEASKAMQWESLVVPGLLQTEAYARQVIAGWNVIDTVRPQEIDRWVDIRMRRQSILRKPHPLELSVVLDEGVLQRRIGNSSIMRAQLEHLSAMARLPNVFLRVLSLDGAHPILAGSFALLEFSAVHDVIFPDIVQTESLTVSYQEDEAETYMYRLAYQELASRALTLNESLEKIQAARDFW